MSLRASLSGSDSRDTRVSFVLVVYASELNNRDYGPLVIHVRKAALFLTVIR